MKLVEKSKAKKKSLTDGWSYRVKKIKCGKPTCKKCPHGPYLYRYRTEKGKTRCEYVGLLPGAEIVAQKINGWQLGMWAKGNVAIETAKEVLGITRGMDLQDWHDRYAVCLRKAKRTGRNRLKKVFYVRRAWQVISEWINKNPARAKEITATIQPRLFN